jgi:hypothetical protein
LTNLPPLIEKVKICIQGMKFQDIKVLGSFRNAVLDAAKGLEDLKKNQYGGDKAKLIDQAVIMLRSTEAFFAQSVALVEMSTEEALEVLEEISMLAKDRLKQAPLYFSPASPLLTEFRKTYPYLSCCVVYTENLSFLNPLIKKVVAVLGAIDFGDRIIRTKCSHSIEASLTVLTAFKQHVSKPNLQLLDPAITELENAKKETEAKTNQHILRNTSAARERYQAEERSKAEELEAKNRRIEELEKKLRELQEKYDQLRGSLVVEAMKDIVIDPSVTPELVMGKLQALMKVLTTVLPRERP